MKFSRHPETALAPLLRGELEGDERARVAAHLEGCARCRAAASGLAETADALRAGLAVAPMPDWTAYRAQLSRRIAKAQAPKQDDDRELEVPWGIWAMMAPLGVFAIVAIIAMGVMLRNSMMGEISAPPPDQLAAAGELTDVNLDLMRNYPLVAHLDMFENYDVIEHLDQVPAAPPGGGGPTSS
jgi:anti-sigma factor RsiW